MSSTAFFIIKVIVSALIIAGVSELAKRMPSLGGLIADPTIYQDVKTLLGRAERSRILRAYVRKTLEENERKAGLDPAGGKVQE